MYLRDSKGYLGLSDNVRKTMMDTYRHRKKTLR